MRQQELGAQAHADASLEVDAAHAEGVVLLEEPLDVEHHAVAEEAALAVVENARRDLVKDELVVLHLHGVAGVGPALVARDDVDVLGKNVYDLSLPLVAPLAADDDGAAALLGHRTPTKRRAHPRLGDGPVDWCILWEKLGAAP
jgi:hypothetical protein